MLKAIQDDSYAVYVQVQDGGPEVVSQKIVEYTGKDFTATLILDFDANANVIGVEVLR